MTIVEKLLRSDRVESFGEAAPADLDRLTSEYGVRLSQAHRDFLTCCNGMWVSFGFDEVEQAGLEMALADITTFYGVANGQEYADLLVLLAPELDPYYAKEISFATPIAIGGDCCTFVEITAGSRVGAIMYTDGEMGLGYLEKAITDWSAPPDALIDTFLEDGYFMPVASSFGALLEMYARLV